MAMDASKDLPLSRQLNSPQKEAVIREPQRQDLSNIKFFVGEMFSSYSDLQKKLAKYEESKSVGTRPLRRS